MSAEPFRTKANGGHNDSAHNHVFDEHEGCCMTVSKSLDQFQVRVSCFPNGSIFGSRSVVSSFCNALQLFYGTTVGFIFSVLAYVLTSKHKRTRARSKKKHTRRAISPCTHTQTHALQPFTLCIKRCLNQTRRQRQRSARMAKVHDIVSCVLILLLLLNIVRVFFAVFWAQVKCNAKQPCMVHYYYTNAYCAAALPSANFTIQVPVVCVLSSCHVSITACVLPLAPVLSSCVNVYGHVHVHCVCVRVKVTFWPNWKIRSCSSGAVVAVPVCTQCCIV